MIKCKCCNENARVRVKLFKGGSVDLCKKHHKEYKKNNSAIYYEEPINHEEYIDDGTWRNVSYEVPKENQRVYISDGKIVDTAVIRNDGRWYPENFHNFVTAIKFWKVLI